MGLCVAVAKVFSLFRDDSLFNWYIGIKVRGIGNYHKKRFVIDSRAYFFVERGV